MKSGSFRNILYTLVFDVIHSVNLSCNWLYSTTGAHNNISVIVGDYETV